ncbi:MAG TPA: TonB-dependent receptor [Terriglobia bacterium]|nr:TonB-dependent receptor [Terriglobia bacterium]
MTTSSTVIGTVTDASGAVMSGATITATNSETKDIRTTESNSDGTFALPGLPSGTYSVTVSKTGFETSVTKGLELHPATVFTLEAALKVGSTNSQVTVEANAVEVQTSTSEVAGQVAGAQAAALPINGRNFQSLSALMPGVTNLQPGVGFGQGADEQGNAMSINGMGPSGSLYLLDGIWNIDAGAMNNLSITPNPDTVQEVRVLQNNYGVQYSLMGANVVLLETKSGTSSFHGSAYDYFRNDALDARNFFSPTVSPVKANIFGYSVGGPLFIPHHFNTDKNKAYFFWSQQWVRKDVPNVIQGATPTAAARSGDESHLCSAYDVNGLCTPAALAAGGVQLTNPATGNPFLNNQIPQAMIQPNSLAIMNALMSLPNNPSGGFQNYINVDPKVSRQRDDQIKGDYNFSSRLRLMAEYLDEHQSLNNPTMDWLGSPFTTNNWRDDSDNQIAQIQLTQMLSPNLVNITSVATSSYIDGYLVGGLSSLSQIPSFSQKLPFAGGFGTDRLPEIDFSGGYPSMGVPAIMPLTHASDLEDTLTDDLSWVKGAHYIQAGGSILFGTKRQTNFSASNGDWFFSGQFTGDPISDFLLGDAASLNQYSSETRPYSQYTLASPYIQDRWKINRRLSLTGGIRYLFEPVPHAQHGYVSIFNPQQYNPAHTPIVNTDGTITATPNYDPLNGLIINGVNGVPPNFTTAHQNFLAPSVGFAWDVFGDGTTSLRGGYQITYTRVPTGGDCSYFCSNNPPFVQSITLITPSFPNALGGKPAPVGAPTLYSQDNNLQPARVQNYSLTLERRFGSNWYSSIAWAGNWAEHVGTYYNVNQPLPDGQYNFNPIINTGSVFSYLYSPYQGYASITTNVSNGNLRWNALEVNLRHPVGHNLFLTAAYTWQHSLSDTRGTLFFENATGVQDIYHPGNDYGNSNINVPQSLGVSAIWNLPWYHKVGGVKELALGDWQLSDITTIQSGFSRDAGLSISNPGLAIRPDKVPGTSITGPKTINEWFNTSAFSAPQYGYFGNAGPGSILGPGTINFDMAVSKDFHIGEHLTSQLRGEFFNAFNHANFNSISTSLGSGAFGQVTGAADPRIIEIALRFQF